ncbi:MAG: hypothetical protein AB1431_14310 [Pseudomonadota bacterium]
MMLNEWSDRDPDPPGHSAWAIILAIIMLVAMVAFLLNIGLMIFAG